MSSDREEVLTAMHSLNLIRSAALTVHESAELIRQVRERQSYGELASVQLQQLVGRQLRGSGHQ